MKLLHHYFDSFKGLPKEIWTLAGVALVHRAGTMVLPFLSLWLTIEKSLPLHSVTLVLTCYGIGSILGAWLGGQGTDRLGAIKTMHFTLWGSAVGLFALMLAPTQASLPWIAGFAAATGEGFRPAAMAATLNRTPAQSHPRAMALIRLAVNLGMAIGPAVGGFLAVYSYQYLFLVDGITCLIASACLAFAFWGRAEAFSSGQPVIRKSSRLLRNPDFVWLLFGSFFVACSFFQLLGVYPLWLKEVALFREDAIGSLLAFNALLIVVIEMPLIAAAERSRRRALLATIGCIAVCIGFSLTGVSTHVAWLVFTVVIWTFGEMLGLPLYNVMVAMVSEEQDRGRAMGLYTMTWALALVIAPSGGIWIYRTFGPSIIWWCIGLLAVPILCIGLWLSRKLDRPAPSAPV